MSTRHVLIIFPYPWAAYSTPLLNLVEVLRAESKVTVLVADNGEFPNGILDEAIFRRIAETPQVLATRLLNRFKMPHTQFQPAEIGRILSFLAALSEYRPDVVIAVDSLGLLIASHAYRSIAYLSLEIFRDESLSLADPSVIQCAITQMPERHRYLFPDANHKVYLIENSMISKGRFAKSPSRKLIYFGHLASTHGLYFFIQVLEHLDAQYTLTIQGNIPPEARKWIAAHAAAHLASGRLILDDRYVSQDAVVDHLKNFGIGLCFYDFQSYAWLTAVESYDFERKVFNPEIYAKLHTTSKIFSYLAAGVPVIGNDIPAMRPVRDYGAGVLLDSPTPAAIADAARTIQSDYDRYVEGCFRASEALDYARMAQPFVEEFIPSSAALRRPRRFARIRFLAHTTWRLWRRSERIRRQVSERIRGISTKLGEKPIVIYGAGPHTEYLIRKTPVSELNIVGIVDRNRTLWNTKLDQWTIEDPDRLLTSAEDVLISSYASQESIQLMLEKKYAGRLTLHTIYPAR